MAESPRTSYGIDHGRPIDWFLIGEGNHARVWFNAEESLVRKTFTPRDREFAARLAAQEFDALKRATEALANVPGVRAPLALELDHQHGEVLMEYCPGNLIYNAIRHPAFGDSTRVALLGQRLGDAIVRLADQMRIDELDFSIRNTLLSEDLQEIILIDFASRADRLPPPDNASALESSLGSFIAGVAIYQLHRETMFRWTAARRLRHLSREMLKHVAHIRLIDLVTVRDVAWHLYWHQSGDRGWMRYLWFRTAGRLLFRALTDSMIDVSTLRRAKAES